MKSDSTIERLQPKNNKSEEKLKSLELIKSAARQLNDPIIGIDSEFKIMYVNEAAESLFGYPEHDLLDKPLDMLSADPLTGCNRKDVEQTMVSNNIWEGTYPSNKKDGSTFICNYTIFPLRETNGHLSAGICILRETTPERTPHQALLESEETVSIALNSADLGLWNYWVETDEIVADERFNNIWHLSREQGPINLDILDKLIHPDDVEKVNKARSAHLEGKTPLFEVTFRAQTISGDWVWVISSGKVVQWDENGQPLRITGTCKDITKHQQTEDSLRESEEVLRATFDAIDSGILVVDDAGRVSHMNRQFAEMWRIPPHIQDTNNNHTMISFVLDQLEEPEAFLSGVEGIYKSTLESLEEIRFKDGRVYERFSCPLVREGEVRGRILNFRDISERRQGEDERKRLEVQLVQSQKMEALGTLAGGIAHDFNNILSAIIGYTELAMNDMSQASARSYLGEVLKAGKRAKDLVSHILTFSRQKKTHHTPLEIKSIVKETTRMLRSIIPTTIEIRQNIIDSGLVLTDPTQIHQMLMNLCTNAVHAMETSGGVLEVCLEKDFIKGDTGTGKPDLPCGPYVRLSVSDTGHGIPPEVIDRIFEPYFTTKEQGRGTGLGLSVVHGIVKDLMGSILCKSIPGQGTTFDIYLPELESGEEFVKPLENEPLPVGNERILIVDDEPALVDLGKRSIESLGYTVESRTSSIEALELFRNAPDRFDLVITDMTMPGMTGDELAHRIIEIRHNIPVILCSGYSEPVMEKQAKNIGIREFVLKPLLRKDLAKTIRKVLDEG